jgi:hypothetical protein
MAGAPAVGSEPRRACLPSQSGPRTRRPASPGGPRRQRTRLADRYRGRPRQAAPGERDVGTPHGSRPGGRGASSIVDDCWGYGGIGVRRGERCTPERARPGEYLDPAVRGEVRLGARAPHAGDFPADDPELTGLCTEHATSRYAHHGLHRAILSGVRAADTHGIAEAWEPTCAESRSTTERLLSRA